MIELKNFNKITLFHLLALHALVIVQPLLDVLGRSPEFFGIRGFSSLDIWCFVCILILIVPIAIYCLVRLLNIFSYRLSIIFELGVVWSYLLILNLMLVKNFSWIATSLVPVIVFLFALVCLLLLYRLSVLRTFLNVLSLCSLVVPLNFLLSDGVRVLAFPSATIEVIADNQKNALPHVVLVVLDELNLHTLLDKELKVDRGLFPNLADFSEQAHFYLNATSINPFTPIAVPAILTGIFPENNKALPSLASYPNNLFTLLAPSYDMLVNEAITKLCPSSLCDDGESNSYGALISATLWSDLLAIYLHKIVPVPWNEKLPDIDGRWENFWENDEGFDDKTIERRTQRRNRVVDFRRYIKRIFPPKKPTLYFYHTILPHFSYEYMPSGRSYKLTSMRGYGGARWSEEPLGVQAAFTRYLAQTATCDNLLGELFAKLKSIGIYDDALIIITADHGMSFQHGTYRRGDPSHASFYEDIMSVPLFIKLPKQVEGIVLNRNVESIDIVPTIADVLKMKIPWSIDGESVFTNVIPRNVKRLLPGRIPHAGDEKANKPPVVKAGEVMTFPVPEEFPRASLNWKLNLPGFDTTNKVNPFYIGPHSELIGKKIDSFPQRLIEDVGVSLSQEAVVKEGEFYLSFKPTDSYCPCLQRGYITNNWDFIRKKYKVNSLAFSLNETIVTVHEPFGVFKDNKTPIEAFLPDSSFTPGLNKLAVFLVGKDESDKINLYKLNANQF
jgi:Sulfatase